MSILLRKNWLVNGSLVYQDLPVRENRNGEFPIASFQKFFNGDRVLLATDIRYVPLFSRGI
jgi:hypothetical protein